MKLGQLLASALIGLLLCSRVAEAEIACKLRYDVRSYMQWYDFGSNLIFGLYR